MIPPSLIVRLELRAKISALLLKRFGPGGTTLGQLNQENLDLVLDSYEDVADEVIKIVDEGRIK